MLYSLGLRSFSSFDAIDNSSVYEQSNPPNLMNTSDTLSWRWEKSGIYTSKSAYSILIPGGRIKWRFTKLWSAMCPRTTKIFMYLALGGRILTQDMLLKRHILSQMGCVMCNSGQLETAIHLLFRCHYAKQVWVLLSTKLGFSLIKTGPSIQVVWIASWEALRCSRSNSDSCSEMKWLVWFVGTAWAIWKEGNEQIFRGSAVPPWILVDRIVTQCELWLKFC